MLLESSDSTSMAAAAGLDATAQHDMANSPRALKLRRWLDSEMEITPTPVYLPDTEFRLCIYQPTPASREELFERARKSPDRQMPHWADIWPSGLALGSFALRYADQLAGKRVLEIGSGLGTTASATLRSGATLVAVDYTPLALGLCRYNAMVNVGKAPRTFPLNWRELTPQALERLRAAGPYPIIMAADVLYESRDIAPLIRLIDRLMEPDGMLWLSEPGRKVAARFLNTLAMRGWRFTTHVVEGPWPGGQTDRINVHFLRRQPNDDLPFSTVGGWRI
ncbi:MAG TPA: methyltransferase domain-containing protein [Thermomicrobiales bacterium]|nr:methyltransferase domain-containing protein [Thermomicrobiales bacterium]